ncbi:MBOAT-domain-containing protein [Backusella circina FSU 941]|nr:MBOAT-domain-containing protein [Backusella circina FSU 941]
MVLGSIFLLQCHLLRQFQGFNTDNVNDYSGVMMLLTIKLTSFGFNVLDGRTTDQSKLLGYNKRMMVIEYPTLVEYFGWIFFFGGFLVGPSSEYMDYKRFITMQVFEVKGKRHVPSPFRATLFLLLKSLSFMAVIAFLSPYFSSAAIDSDTWRQLSFIRKIIYMQVAAFTSRSKYYVAWFLSEGASVLSGFGFNGYDKEGNVRWDRFTNIYVKKCELSQSIKEILDNWNISANRWLRYYVYARVTPPNQTGGAKSTLITYGVSALWHGFYPGYYMFFLSITPFQLLARQIRRTFRPFVMDPVTKEAIFPLKFIYDCGGVIISMIIVNILSAAFNLLYWTPAITAWKNIYFVHYLLLIAGNIFLNSTSEPLRKMQKAREEKALKARPVELPATPPAEKEDDSKILKSQ